MLLRRDARDTLSVLSLRWFVGVVGGELLETERVEIESLSSDLRLFVLFFRRKREMLAVGVLFLRLASPAFGDETEIESGNIDLLLCGNFPVFTLITQGLQNVLYSGSCCKYITQGLALHAIFSLR